MGAESTVAVDIDDKAGALARIVALLASKSLSIKNIGITHNREQQDGVLRVEFYQEESIAKASQILTAKGYAVFSQS